MKIQFQLNGTATTTDQPPMRRLLDVLREELLLTGTKEGCGEGECGTCTVLVDDVPMNACMIPIGQLEGRTVLTIEGLGTPEALTPLQSAFVTDGGAQCGICTPGMLLSAHALLKRNRSPSEFEIREALAGNLCRCTGYERIVDSVRACVARVATGMPLGGPGS